MENDDSSPPWSGIERRTNLRLRALIDELRAGVHDNRTAIEMLTARVVNLAKDVEALKKARS